MVEGQCAACSAQPRPAGQFVPGSDVMMATGHDSRKISIMDVQHCIGYV